MHRFGKYEARRLLGQGMGLCYEAVDPILGRMVTVRTLGHGLAHDTERRQRFLDEAMAAARLRHPQLTTIYDLGEAGGEPYVVLEHVDGVDLATILARGETRPVEWQLHILTQVCQGVAHAHRHGVPRVGLRPSSIFVTAADAVKITVLGTAMLHGSQSSWSALGVEEVAYLAPEQVEGRITDHRTDVFSLGAIAYELLTSRKAFPGDRLPEVLYRILHTRPDPAAIPRSRYSPALEQVVMKALARDCGERYATVDEVTAELEGLLWEAETLASSLAVEATPRPEPSSAPASEDELERLLGLALGEAAEGRLEQAQVTAETLRGLAPDDPRVGELATYLREQSARQVSRALISIAREHLVAGKLLEARAAVTEALALDPREPQARALARSLARVLRT